MRQASEGIRSYYRLQDEGARDRYRSEMSKRSNWFKTTQKQQQPPATKPAIRRRKAQLQKNKEKIPVDNRPVDVVVFIPVRLLCS